ncbi:hypothetical protein [Sphingomonas bacterium]|uniref:hypothetical protein n=1 Tax=Sphingomonas bacterium TaxID=1895847 RepID=UPI001575FDC6|nr:hypothetical protein [Sphingomonas bacterium]
MDEVESADLSLWGHALGVIDRWVRAKRILRASLVLFGSFLAGLAQFSLPLSDHWKLALGLAGSAMALFGGIVLLWLDDVDVKLLGEARSAVQRWKAAVIRREPVEAALKTEQALNVGFDQLIGVLGRSLSMQHASLDDRLKVFVSVGARQLIGPMNLGGEHIWTISIFRKVEIDGAFRMKRVASNWADREEEERDTRTWAYGKGWTGAAWQFGEERLNAPFVVEMDTATDQARARYDDDGQAEATDYDRFRSVASIPFRVGKERSIFGVVTATCSRVGAFDVTKGSPGLRNFETIRSFTLLAAALAAGN